MKILAIDASTMAGSVAYIEDGKLVGEYYVCNKLTHAETIMPMLEHLKDLTNIDMEELDAVATTAGPGSFTGVRIGVATAKALALSLNIPLIGISTLDVMAHSQTFTDYVICPIIDARRNSVYTSLYLWECENLKQLTPAQVMEVEELLQLLKIFESPIIFVGDGIDVYKEQIVNELGDSANFATTFSHMPKASVLAHLAIEAYNKGETQNANDFAPIYLKKTQAERELEEK